MPTTLNEIRWPFAEFLAAVGRGATPIEMSKVVQEFTRSGESVQIVGQGPLRMLWYPLGFAAINVAALVRWWSLSREPRLGMKVIAMVGLAATVGTVFLFVWMLRGAIVMISGARLAVIVGLTSRRVSFEVATSSVSAIVEKQTRSLGLSLSDYMIELSDGSIRQLGTLDFRRVSA